ncbi:MAG: cobalamin B12-binding domain-containing protein [Nitrospirae bacterium]|nr:cobalamin B12-binding domain-containing protein [Nitrospirota bacterium]
MKKKILFITPPYHCGVVEVAGHWVPLTFVYLAGAVREAGFEPVIYDAMTKRHGFKEIKKKISEEKPDYVAATAITSTVFDALEILKTAKEIKPGITTIIGGVHPHFMYKEMLENKFVDYVVRGEGEETIKELLLCLSKGGDPADVKGIAYRSGQKITATPPRQFIQDLDKLPTAWDLVEWKDYRYFVIPKSRLGSVSTSRGCSHDCTFCSQQKFWHQSWRGRTPESAVKEIEHLAKTYGVNVFLIPDEHPTHDRARWERLLDLLIEKDLGIYLLMETRAEDIVRDKDLLWKYKKAGVIHIYIGVEATDQETLDLIKKDVKVEIGLDAIRLIHEHGMITETSFLLGFPHETKKSVAKTLKLSKIYNPDFAHYLALAPWPYADMYKELLPYIATKDYRKYNLIDPVIKPEKMSLKAVDWAIIDCYRSFYMGKLKEILTMKDPFKKRYLLVSMKLIMNSSFIVDKLGSLGMMPPQVQELMNKLKTEEAEEEKPAQELTSKISMSVKISAPVGKVFDYVTNPENWTRYVTSLVDVRNLSTKTVKAGMTFEWTYRMLGMNMDGKGRITEFHKDKKFAMQMEGSFPIREVYFFSGDSKATTLTFEIHYEVPGKVLGVIANRLVIEKLNRKEAVAVLKKVKDICEAENI